MAKNTEAPTELTMRAWVRRLILITWAAIYLTRNCRTCTSGMDDNPDQQVGCPVVF
jgi:hypothetical protein